MSMLKTIILSQIFIANKVLTINEVNGIEDDNKSIEKCKKLSKIEKCKIVNLVF